MDSRFKITVHFSIYGQDYAWDASLNWTDGYNGEIDRRITEWFERCYLDAKIKWDEENSRLDAERNAELLKATEVAEMKRLMVKYPEQIDKL